MRFAHIVILFLRRLNAHLSSIVSSKPFQMPVEVVSRTTAFSGSRLSSFGFSGTIAHGAFEVRKPVTSPTDSKSLYRNRRFVAPGDTTRLGWLFDAPGPQQSRLDEAVVFSGALSTAAEAFFSHHVVGGTIVLPGVGFVEMAFAASSSRALAAVAFLRPCSSAGPGRGEKRVLRCTRCTGKLEIASARGTGSSSFATCFAGTLVNIESGCAESILGRGFSTRMEQFIKAPSTRPNLVVSQGTSGPRPRLLMLSSRIGGTAWTCSAWRSLCSASSARRSLCSDSRQSHRNSNLMNVASNASKWCHLHLARRQSCKSLRGTVLPRSRMLASHAHNQK